MKLGNNKTGVIVMTLFAVLMIWDGFVVYFAPENWSVSQYILYRTGWNPFGFYVGVAVGHLMTNMYPDTTELRSAWNSLTSAFFPDRGSSPPTVERMEKAVADIDNQGPLRWFKKL